MQTGIRIGHSIILARVSVLPEVSTRISCMGVGIVGQRVLILLFMVHGIGHFLGVGVVAVFRNSPTIHFRHPLP